VTWENSFNEDEKVTVTDWVKVNKALETLKEETDKIMDEITKEESRKEITEKSKRTREKNKKLKEEGLL